MKTIITNPSAMVSVPIDPDKDISGVLLIESGWKRSGSVYKKGDNEVKYDGERWELNGKRIFKMKDLW